jgi:hypothetical protein
MPGPITKNDSAPRNVAATVASPKKPLKPTKTAAEIPLLQSSQVHGHLTGMNVPPPQTLLPGEPNGGGTVTKSSQPDADDEHFDKFKDLKKKSETLDKEASSSSLGDLIKHNWGPPFSKDENDEWQVHWAALAHWVAAALFVATMIAALVFSAGAAGVVAMFAYGIILMHWTPGDNGKGANQIEINKKNSPDAIDVQRKKPSDEELLIQNANRRQSSIPDDIISVQEQDRSERYLANSDDDETDDDEQLLLQQK